MVIALVQTLKMVYIYVNSTEVASSAVATNWTTFAGAAWCHVTFQKREESLGLYQYEVFLNGNLVCNYQSTSDISVADVTVAGKYSGPVSGNSFIGWIDDLVVDDVAPYNTAYVVLLKRFLLLQVIQILP